ncbi:hypothetical protein JW960_18870 [candidate division KSB1 bacterium]|nr:hypothetical protein [candidate division KSB1 bacterium]
MKRYLIFLILLVGIVPRLLASDVILKWESEPGRTALMSELSQETQLDQSGDGVDEIIMLRKNDEGVVNGLVIVDGSTKGIIGILVSLLRDGVAVNRRTFKGFYDCDGDGSRELLIATGRDIYLVDPVNDTVEFALEGTYRLLSVSDSMNQAPVDMYIGETEKNVIQIWGSNR